MYERIPRCSLVAKSSIGERAEIFHVLEPLGKPTPQHNRSAHDPYHVAPLCRRQTLENLYDALEIRRMIESTNETEPLTDGTPVDRSRRYDAREPIDAAGAEPARELDIEGRKSANEIDIGVQQVLPQ
jgi:hypothetical protein